MDQSDYQIVVGTASQFGRRVAGGAVFDDLTTKVKEQSRNGWVCVGGATKVSETEWCQTMVKSTRGTAGGTRRRRY